MNKTFRYVAALLLLLTLNARCVTAFAQGTAFTYQGRLNVNGAPAGGSYDIQFTLYATNVTGMAVAGPVTNIAVAVSNGLFTTTVDFGGEVFTGTNYWLQTAVSTNGADAFSALMPRQPLTPVPYAIFANSASNLLGTLPTAQLNGTIPSGSLSGSYGNEVAFNNGANTFDGTFYGNFLGGSFLGGTFSGQFVGDGSQLININPAHIAGSIAFLNSNQVFTAQNDFLQNIGLGTTNANPLYMVDALGAFANMRLEATNSDNGAVLELRNNSTNNFNQYLGAINFNNFSNSYPGQIGYFTYPQYPGYDFFQFRINGLAQFTLMGDIEGAGAGTLINGVYNQFEYGEGNVIVGGGTQTYPNAIPDGDFDFIGTGYGNHFSPPPSTNQDPFVSGSFIGGGTFNTVVASFSAIVGGSGNQIYPDTFNEGSSFIGGGGDNLVSSNAPYSFIGGGLDNQIYGDSFNDGSSFVGGGYLGIINTNSRNSAIVGGDRLTIGTNSPFSFIGSGERNTIGANSDHGVIAGGFSNQVAGTFGTVPGGVNNAANGIGSFAAGTYAQATNNGSFVLTDNLYTNFSSTASNQFSARFTGGIVLVTGGAGVTLDGQPLVTGSYSSTVSLTNPANTFAGNGGGLANVNAATLNGQPATAFAPANGSANYIQNQSAVAQTASFNISGNAAVAGLFISGSGTGTSNAPAPPGLIIRRVNSLSATVSNVVARTDVLTLERDGTSEGLLIRYPAGVGRQTINCLAQSYFGTNIIVHASLNGPPTGGTIQLVTSAQQAVHAEISFGNTYENGYTTKVSLDRYDDGTTSDFYWVGTLISTYNQ